MSAKKSTNWFWSDWAGDEAVRSLTPAERGLWIDLLALAARGNPTGYVTDARGDAVAVEQIAHFANCSAAEASSLIDCILAKGVASRDRTGRLFNRRMLRDIELATKRQRAGRAGGAVTAMKWHANNGVPYHLPQQVPKHPGRAPLPRKNLTSSFVGTARADARAQKSGSAMEHPEPAADQASEAEQPPLTELQKSMLRKGWIK